MAQNRSLRARYGVGLRVFLKLQNVYLRHFLAQQDITNSEDKLSLPQASAIDSSIVELFKI